MAARNGSRKGRRRTLDPAESLINLGNERLTGLFRWTLMIFAVILNNLNAEATYDQGRVNEILAAWGVVCLSTLLLLFLQIFNQIGLGTTAHGDCNSTRVEHAWLRDSRLLVNFRAGSWRRIRI